ncbi:MAG TPA: type 4a pilus biogenesis protein PilO [Gaiellaceae bacterium]|nr:type 4a pilus biogenesis protein PilO [Gaiellaceae bacterium]
MKRDVPIAVVIAPVLLVVAVVGYFFLVKPKQEEAGRTSDEIAELATQIAVAQAAAQAPASGRDEKIRVADVFRVTKAMPDEDDMPGILLELDGVASAAGVRFISISPQAPVVQSTYTALPVNLSFEGNYYDLTDFLFRLRNLVNVRDGKLEADGRLYTLDTLSMQEGPNGFPDIAASLTVTAYVYSTTPTAAPVVPAAPASTDTASTTTTPTTPETAPVTP